VFLRNNIIPLPATASLAAAERIVPRHTAVDSGNIREDSSGAEGEDSTPVRGVLYEPPALD
jgi:hypothetical protein